MTRLTTDLLLISDRQAAEYADNVLKITGKSVQELAYQAALSLRHANGETSAHAMPDLASVTCAVVPVTAGEGEIGGFSNSIASLLKYLGVRMVQAKGTDIEGLYNAMDAGAEIIFAADDHRYMVFDAHRGRFCENDAATSYGYAEALCALSGGTLNGREVLLIGCGRVGRIAARALKEKGAKLTVFDRDRAEALALEDIADTVMEDISGISLYDLILDATNEGGWLTPDIIAEGAAVSTPGIPLSFAFAPEERPDIKLFHDTLHTGTAVMLYAVLLGCHSEQSET